MWVQNEAVSLWRHKLTHKQKYQITAILMQVNFSKWPIYTPFIEYIENLLCLRENNLSLCMK